jgi:hypothetical protein
MGDGMLTRIAYSASEHVREMIAMMGRTEDVKFSPNNKRLALAGYARNRVFLFDISISSSSAPPEILLARIIEISSPVIRRPHGVDFIDDDTIIVASRKGNVSIIRIPDGELDEGHYDLNPIEVILQDSGLDTPGSLCVVRKDDERGEVLVCNNRGSSVTTHLLEGNPCYSANSHKILLKKWLDVPDGVSASPDQNWIAISNHHAHSVFLYERALSPGAESDPDGILRGVQYPHGVRFTADGQFVVVASAGTPYVQVYKAKGPAWRSVQIPFRSIRVLSDEEFWRGRSNPQEGGPKGLDVSSTMDVLVTTNEVVPLAFYDLGLVTGSYRGKDARVDYQASEQEALAIQHELQLLGDMAEKLRKAEERGRARAARQTKASSWRGTAPLRSLHRIVAPVWSRLKRPLLGQSAGSDR